MFPTSSKPYILRALYEWSANESTTPHLVVEVDENCQVPRSFIKDGMITFNVGMLATKDLMIGDHWVSFSARFSGKAQEILFPVARVQAFYVRETQEGVPFLVEDKYDLDDNPDSPDDPSGGSKKQPEKDSTPSDKPKRKSGLKIVK